MILNEKRKRWGVSKPYVVIIFWQSFSWDEKKKKEKVKSEEKSCKERLLRAKFLLSPKLERFFESEENPVKGSVIGILAGC